MGSGCRNSGMATLWQDGLRDGDGSRPKRDNGRCRAGCRLDPITRPLPRPWTARDETVLLSSSPGWPGRLADPGREATGGSARDSAGRSSDPGTMPGSMLATIRRGDAGERCTDDLPLMRRYHSQDRGSMPPLRRAAGPGRTGRITGANRRLLSLRRTRFRAMPRLRQISLSATRRQGLARPSGVQPLP